VVVPVAPVPPEAPDQGAVISMNYRYIFKR
jgi:hypothetical protein